LLKGVANYASSSDMKAVVTVTLVGKMAEQARFAPMMTAGEDHSKH
jgi:hypothetical protein